jgi:hypothetical protein
VAAFRVVDIKRARAMDVHEDCGCKVDRVAEAYGLRSLDERIIRRREQKDYSLRDLESYVNGRVLGSAMGAAGMDVLDGQAEDFCDRLRGEGDELRHQEARRHLTDAGVDVDEVIQDFVSYQTVRKHLNECLDISTSREYTPNSRKSRNRIGAMRARVQNVTERIVERFRTHDALEMGGEHEAVVSVKIRCSSCDGVYHPGVLLEEGGCECSKSAEDRVTSRHEA